MWLFGHPFLDAALVILLWWAKWYLPKILRAWRLRPSGLKVAEERSFELERETGLMFSQYGRVHLLWDGYWEWKGADLMVGSSSDLGPGGAKAAWFLRPEGSEENLWVRTSDQSQAQKLLEHPGKGTYELMWDEYGPGPDVGYSRWYAVDYQRPRSEDQDKRHKFAEPTAKAHHKRIAEFGKEIRNLREKTLAEEEQRLKARDQSLKNCSGASDVLQFPTGVDPNSRLYVLSVPNQPCPHWNEGQKLGPCCQCVGGFHHYKHGEDRCVICNHRWTAFN